MKNRMVDLRNHLFATLEALQDEEKPMELDRAKTIAAVAREVISSAKVEVDYLKVTGSKPVSDFIEGAPALEGPRVVSGGTK